MPDKELECQVDEQTERENDADQRGDAHELCNKLGRIAVEQARDAAIHAVPAPAVIARAVREEAYRQHAPQAVRAVYGNGANRIVNLEDVLEERAAQADQHTGTQADDAGAGGVDEA